MFITLITDCKDDNALGRSTTRLATFFNCQITTIGVNGWEADLEAAGNLIDVLDASSGEKGVVIVNVAPRHQAAKKWPNGTPFCFFNYKETLVVSSVDGLVLSLIKKLGVVGSVNIMDIPTVLKSLREKGVVSEELEDHITKTQFRSFEFLPRVAKWLTEGLEIPHEEYSLENVADAPKAIWWIDNFGNCKTSLLAEEVEFEEEKEISLNCHSELDSESKEIKLTCYSRLKDVPDHQAALIIGSSGLEEKRFLEIVVQGKSAEKELELKAGQVIS